MKIRRVGVELFNADGRTDIKLIVAFPNFANVHTAVPLLHSAGRARGLITIRTCRWYTRPFPRDLCQAAQPPPSPHSRQITAHPFTLTSTLNNILLPTGAQGLAVHHLHTNNLLTWQHLSEDDKIYSPHVATIIYNHVTSLCMK
jgi:hypothetical protein